MIPLAAFAFLVAAGPGDVPKLGPGEFARLSEGGGRRGYAGRLVVMEDGAVQYGWSLRGEGPTYGRTRLSGGEMASLRRLVRRTDFDALRREPRAAAPPREPDGIERGIAARQGRRTQGWSSALWQAPRREPPLVARLRGLLARMRENVVATGEDAFRLLQKPR